jgi:hypothetical protein
MGHIKLANFKASKNKLVYVYVLTPEGIAHRTQLAAAFIRRKVAEFEAIQAELERLRRILRKTCTIEARLGTKPDVLHRFRQ